MGQPPIRWQWSISRVRGVDGLRVVDAEHRARPNLTGIMIGERVADWMRAEN
jgi:choline dehydrogenase-like flavoprotein